MTFTSRKKRIVAAAAVGALALGGGLAYAYWTSTGSGTGSATTGTSTAFTVTSTTSGSALTPGGPADTVSFTVTNPGTGNQKLTAVAVTVAASDGSSWTAVPGCSAGDYTVGTPSFNAGVITPGNNIVGTVTLQMKDTGINQDACKGATVPLYIAAS